MKKLVSIIALFVSSTIFSQQEIKIDLFDVLVFKTVEVSYEHYLNEQSSVGMSALFNFEGKTSDLRYSEKNMFTPYFRHYFTSIRNWNIFGEAFFGLNNGEKEIKDSVTATISYKPYTDGAFGVGIGTKYVAESGLVVGAHVGVGRNLFSSNSPIIVPRGGLNVGWKF